MLSSRFREAPQVFEANFLLSNQWTQNDDYKEAISIVKQRKSATSDEYGICGAIFVECLIKSLPITIALPEDMLSRAAKLLSFLTTIHVYHK